MVIKNAATTKSHSVPSEFSHKLTSTIMKRSCYLIGNYIYFTLCETTRQGSRTMQRIFILNES